jgi:hypothetical protein
VKTAHTCDGETQWSETASTDVVSAAIDEQKEMR